ncbi:glutamine--fructose-6-phosphate aminotransferase [Candidatus Gottesmanbacteria bacterium RIFCSPLOWO2_01_FULL_43_11b]|uniref:Glutamine--fructose-6-phosphate aminotransferase [isomerizing] n=1 Tax=Candidatus Gottesmanbacteria bacterium RIFCSPLOWO2_01_FULL_43_11b TaxID=1798392 RepID=A0A1F6AGH6_9BACT|nr:MAG: glutamine--fructose-6-phosphate aminotransferase [Candidatus Gottesmanbacteria bacterium RIFCSPLOWO2_01_FULL_43_11b]
MCGIFGYVGPSPHGAKIVLEGLKRLEYRGYDSWGVAVVPASKGKIVVKKKAGRIGKASVSDMPKGSVAFGHTRWATHGGVTDVNAHPHLDCTGNLAVIHNGIFENYESIKQDLIKKGHRFISQTDTEVIAHLIEEYAKTMMLSKAVQRAYNEMEGLNAFIVIQTKEHLLLGVRNGSPLVVGFGDPENYLASDAAALIPHTRQVHFLEDDQMVIVGTDQVNIFNARTGERIRPLKQKLTWSAEQAEKGKFPYFMLKEIYEQPGLISEIAGESTIQAKKIAEVLKNAHGAYIVGCGTAGYAALAAQYLFSAISNRHVNSVIGSEFGYLQNFLVKRSAVLALSQSGETMDILEGVKKAKDKGAKIVSLVNVVGSSLWRLSDVRLPIGVGPEKGVASTKAFIGKLTHLILLSYAMIGKITKGQRILTRAAKAATEVLKEQRVSKIMKLAKKLKNTEHIFVIGRGLSYPAALETALKIKEISYIHAEGLAAGELKHGPLALVTKGIPCIVFAPNDETQGANLAGAMEMKARGAYIIGISPKKHEVFDYYLPVKDVGEATIIPNVIVAQLLAYYLAIERGFDPDMPRNLAKSVTVK